jgi:co-chaperonin GroES (HSP10)
MEVKVMYQALGANIIVKVIYPETKSSIVIPKTATTYKKYAGQIKYIVESVGSKSRWKDELSAGRQVDIIRHEGKPFIRDGAEYRLVRDRWVMGVWNG